MMESKGLINSLYPKDCIGKNPIQTNQSNNSYYSSYCYCSKIFCHTFNIGKYP